MIIADQTTTFDHMTLNVNITVHYFKDETHFIF